MYRLAKMICNRLLYHEEPMKKLTAHEEKTHNSAKECWICEKPFGEEDNLKKVRDHDHITGNYIISSYVLNQQSLNYQFVSIIYLSLMLI